MTIEAVKQAARDHLEAMTGADPVVFQNVSHDNVSPRFEVAEGQVLSRFWDVQETLEDSSWLLQIAAVVPLGTGTEKQDAMIEQIKSHFKSGQVLGAGKVDGAISLSPPYEDKTDSRVAATINVRALIKEV